MESKNTHGSYVHCSTDGSLVILLSLYDVSDTIL